MKRNRWKRGKRNVEAHQFAVERHMSHDHRRISLENWQLIKTLIRRDCTPNNSVYGYGVLLFSGSKQILIVPDCPVENKSSQEVDRTTINLLVSIKEKVHYVTSDN